MHPSFFPSFLSISLSRSLCSFLCLSLSLGLSGLSVSLSLGFSLDLSFCNPVRGALRADALRRTAPAKLVAGPGGDEHAGGTAGSAPRRRRRVRRATPASTLRRPRVRPTPCRPPSAWTRRASHACIHPSFPPLYVSVSLCLSVSQSLPHGLSFPVSVSLSLSRSRSLSFCNPARDAPHVDALRRTAPAKLVAAAGPGGGEHAGGRAGRGNLLYLSEWQLALPVNMAACSRLATFSSSSMKCLVCKHGGKPSMAACLACQHGKMLDLPAW